MNAKHLLRAAFAGVVLLGAYLGHSEPADGHPVKMAFEQISGRTVDRTDVPWLAPAIDDLDQIRAF
jgi:hypothetical protein